MPKIDEVPIPQLWPSHLFVYLKHECTSNQPQPLRENARRPQIDQYNDKKAQAFDALPISS